MAPSRRQSATLTIPESSLTSDSSSEIFTGTFDSSLSVSATPDAVVTSSTSQTTSEASTSVLEGEIGKNNLNGTDTSDLPVPSEESVEYGIAPISTEEPLVDASRTFPFSNQLSSPVANGTTTDDPSDASTSEGVVSQNAISKDVSTSTESVISSFSRTSIVPHASESPNRIGNEGAAVTSPNNDPTPSNSASLFLSPATTFTSAGTVYVQSTFASSFETTLPNGSVVTTAKAFTTLLPAPTAQTNVNDDGDRVQDPSGPPLPIPVLNPSSESFFQRPAAATGVFVVVLLIIGSLIWMCLIIRRHRRQVAVATKERKRPSYMYGSTGISPRDRRSHMSYDSQNWPERFDRHETDNVASTSQVVSTTSTPVDSQVNANDTPLAAESETPQMGTIGSSASTLPMNHPIIRSRSQRQPSIFRTTSPPIPPRSPLRTWSSPTRASVAIPADDTAQGFRYRDSVGFGANHQALNLSSGLMPTPTLLPLSRTASSGQRSRQRAASTTSLNWHPYPVASTSTVPTLAPVFDAEPSSRRLLERRTSDTSSHGSIENPFRSSAYIVPSPTPSAELRGTTERLSNPFEDAESPPHSPVAFTYVREGSTTQPLVLGRGVSLRRNDSMKDKPRHTEGSHFTPDASTVEWASSGSEAASSNLHLNMIPSSKVASRYRASERPVPRKSTSISTAETSVVASVHRLGSLDEAELFYNPAFAVASPMRIDNPEFPEVRR